MRAISLGGVRIEPAPAKPRRERRFRRMQFPASDVPLQAPSSSPARCSVCDSAFDECVVVDQHTICCRSCAIVLNQYPRTPAEEQAAGGYLAWARATIQQSLLWVPDHVVHADELSSLLGKRENEEVAAKLATRAHISGVWTGYPYSDIEYAGMLWDFSCALAYGWVVLDGNTYSASPALVWKVYHRLVTGAC